VNREAALGSDSPRLVETLDAYSVLLRTGRRESEATAVEARARAILSAAEATDRAR